MPRNQTFPLTFSESAKAEFYENQITTCMMNGITRFEIAFIKRNGEHRVIEGEFMEFVGAPSTTTRAVVLDIGEGMRSANTYNIESICAIESAL